MSTKKKPNRTQLLSIIATNLRHLVRCDTLESFRAIEGIVELTGWLSNHTESTHDELAKGVLALCSIIDLHDLINTAHGAVFYRRQHDGYTSERARQFGNEAIASAGVDATAWEAELDRDLDAAAEARAA